MTNPLPSSHPETHHGASAEGSADAAPSRFSITWKRGAYYVSIPNYQGGEVVRAEIVDALVKALEAAREYIAVEDDFKPAVRLVEQIDAALAAGHQKAE